MFASVQKDDRSHDDVGHPNNSLKQVHKRQKSEQYDFKVLPFKKDKSEEEKAIIYHPAKEIDETNVEMNDFRLHHEDSIEFFK
jgi:hypothetical protein